MKSNIIICFILSTFCFGFTDTAGIETLPEDICLVAGDNALTIARAGGRIISFTHNGKEILTQKNEHENYGSTLWTDPQSNWNWPPYEALDQLNYEGGMMGDSLCLTSRKDEKSGFQIKKIVKADSLCDCFHITYIIRNGSGESKSVGPWEVTRMPAKGISFFMRGEAARLPESTLDGVIEKEGVVWFSLNDAPLKGGQKLFSTARGGWLAHIYQGLLFVKQFEDISPRQLAPQQGEIEIYANEDKAYIELENHGIYRLLQPGESLHYSVTWHLLKLPDDVRAETGNSRLIEMVQKTIL